MIQFTFVPLTINGVSTNNIKLSIPVSSAFGGCVPDKKAIKSMVLEVLKSKAPTQENWLEIFNTHSKDMFFNYFQKWIKHETKKE